MTRSDVALPPPPIPDRVCDCALFLDVDGTLLDFADRPDAVDVPPILVPLVEELAAGLDGALALVSGRSIEVLDELFAPLRLACAGLHGVERRDGNGIVHRVEPGAGPLERVRSAAAVLASQYPGLLLEDKGSSIALHYGAVLDSAPMVRASAALIARDTGFELQPGRRVLELKPAGRNKGDAVVAFLGEPVFAGRLPIVFGDDLTDENAFAVVGALGGMTVQIGDRRASSAQFRLENPASALVWLRQFANRLK